MTGGDSGSLWEWFATRLRAAPAREPLPLSTIRFIQASLLAQDGEAETAVGVVEQVLTDPGLPALMRSVAQSLRAAQLIALGRPMEAIAAAQAATDAARRLDRANPGSAAVLARALAGEAMMVVQARRFAEALALSEEAVAIARTCPAAEDGPLAPALDALVAALTFLERPADALPIAEEVVAIRRRHGRPDQLATALGHVAGLRARTGDTARGVELGEEAIAIQRLHGRPMDLALALNHQAGRVRPTDPERALRLADESVSILRAVDHPDAHALRGLANALSSCAIALRQLRRVPEQVAAAREAVAVRRTLPDDVAANPQSITGPLYFLGEGLLQLSIGHARAGRFAEALDVNAEGLAAFREIERLTPGRQRAAIGVALTNRGNMLVQSGRLDEAAGVHAEAVAVLRTASADPAHDDQLAMALNNLTSVHLRTGRYAEAVVVATEAAEIRERLHEADPDRMTPTFANTVNTLAEAFLKDGQLAEARAMAEWAKQLLSTVSTEQTGQQELFHAANADTYSQILLALGDLAAARLEAETAAVLARRLVVRQPGQSEFLARIEERLAVLVG